MAKYTPPIQSKASQFIDVLVVLVLTIVTLYLPTWMKLAGASKVPNPVENPTWESLGQNAAMVEKWNQLGYPDAASAAETITARFDYSFTAFNLIAMIVVIVGYYVIMLRYSETEYRDVINEKFDGKGK
ncbi:MAG: hypothetical protein ABI832_22420 [bacterium]